MELKIPENNQERNSQLSQPVPPPPNSADIPMAGSSGTWFSGGKLIAIIVVIILLLGAGVYFAFFSKSPSGNIQNLSTSSQQGNQISPNNKVLSAGDISFKCLDLLTLTDIQSLTGVTGLQETDGKDAVPTELTCSYASIGTILGDKNSSFNFFMGIDSKTAPELKHNFDLTKGLVNGVDVPGVGSAAFKGDIAGYPIVIVTSSNNKYSIHLQGDGSLNSLSDKTKVQQVDDMNNTYIVLAKFIDANLSKLSSGSAAPSAPAIQAVALTCDNLITLEQAKSIVGDNTLVEGSSGNVNSSLFGNSSISLGCSFTSAVNPGQKTLRPIGLLYINVYASANTDIQAEFNQWKKINQGKDFLSGPGSSAAQNDGKYAFISSNKKYFFTVTGTYLDFTLPDSQGTARSDKIGLDAAKIIDANLNKY